MPETPYRGQQDDRRYNGETADITYNLKRCIHAEHCVHNLATVFDTQKRPWINANGADAETIVEVVAGCPSGALHVERKDDGIGEPIPAENRIIVRRNGQLEMRGNLKITGANLDLQSETRATLCRCGASHNKPFCDNSHQDIGFQSETFGIGNINVRVVGEGDTHDDVLHITPLPNGSLELNGYVEIFNEDGERLFAGTQTWLCRCGGSGKKPFCDSTHRKNGFQAD